MTAKLYSLLKRVEKIDNTPDTGHGDFMRVSWRPILTVQAPSEKAAKSHFQRMLGGLSFDGKFPKHCISRS